MMLSKKGLLFRIIVSFVAVIVAFSAFGFPTTAENNIKCEMKDGVMTISGTGEIEEGFTPESEEPIKKIIIAEGITAIGRDSFEWMENLESVIISDGVTSIGDFSFGSCHNLAEMVIPESVTEIGPLSFTESLWYESFSDGIVQVNGIFLGINEKFKGTVVDIPNGITKVNAFAFMTEWELDKVTMPDSVTDVGYGTFEGCRSIKEIVLSSNITELSRYMFNECNCLSKIVIPNKVTKIGEYAFLACTSLKTLVIPENVVDIGEKAFGYVFHDLEMELVIIDKAAIEGVYGSAAEVYAKENKIKFIGKKSTEQVRLLATDMTMRVAELGNTAEGIISHFFDKGHEIKLNDDKGNEISASEIIKTGYVAFRGEKKYDIAVCGDTDGNGIVNVTDYVRIKRCASEKFVLEGAFKCAADTDCDDAVAENDVEWAKKAVSVH